MEDLIEDLKKQQKLILSMKGLIKSYKATNDDLILDLKKEIKNLKNQVKKPFKIRIIYN